METTTITEVTNTTDSDSPVMLESNMVVAIAVGVSVGVAVFAVFMFIGLANGFRYLLQKIKGDPSIHYLFLEYYTSVVTSGYEKDPAMVISSTTNKQSDNSIVDNVEIQITVEVTK